MTRRRRHFANPTRKRPTKWCRQFFSDFVKDESNLVVGDGLGLCPITTAIDSQEDIVSDTIKIVGSVTRNLSSGGDTSLMWIVAKQKFDVSTGNMLQVVNPYDELALSSQDIMGFGFLEVPATMLIPSTDAHTANRRAVPFQIHVKAKRSLERNTNSIILTFASQTGGDTDSVVLVRVATSMLMKFG